MKLKTKKLTLRPLKNSDKAAIANLLNDREISKWLVKVPHPYSLKNAEIWIKENRNLWNRRNKKDFYFGIELKRNKNFIGEIWLNLANHSKKRGTIGYWLGRKYWKKGYALEATKRIIKFAFNNLNLGSLYAESFSKNVKSIKLLARLGFKKKGRKKSIICKADNKPKVQIIYELSKEFYSTQYLPLPLSSRTNSQRQCSFLHSY